METLLYSILSFYELLKRKFLALLICHGKVLDVGCGKGTFPIKHGIVGLDINKEQLKLCAYDYKVIGDASCLPFKSDSFDVSVESACLSYVKSKRKALQEMRRVAERCYMIEQIRNRKRLHWFTLLELNSMGEIVFSILRTFIVKVRFDI